MLRYSKPQFEKTQQQQKTKTCVFFGIYLYGQGSARTVSRLSLTYLLPRGTGGPLDGRGSDTALCILSSDI